MTDRTETLVFGKVRRTDMLVLVQRETYTAGKLFLTYDEDKTQSVYVSVKCNPENDPSKEEWRYHLDSQIARASFLELLSGEKTTETQSSVLRGRTKEEMIQYLKELDLKD